MISEIPVTRTRILLPRRRSDLLSRKRLLDYLSDALDTKLVIVAAPAGYGKTSLLIDFANQIEFPVCWYAIDPLDQDLQRFVTHFIASLNLRFPNFGQSSLAVLQNSPQGKIDLDYLVTAVVNDAYENITEHFLIVLDDYHLVDSSKTVNQFVSRFIQDVDENCHLFITSRTLLSLPDMPLMVARSQVKGLSFDELVFEPDEIQALFLQNYQQNISLDTAAELRQQTEGWITGLLLTTQTIGGELSDRSRASRVAGAGLNEYFGQLLLTQSPPIRDFLLRAALLEEFDAELCAQTIGKALGLNDEKWDVVMEQVMRNNLFVLPVGEDGNWLRFHHLFRDYLQNRVQREYPEDSRKIQLCLAEAYAERGKWEEAYRLYRRLGSNGYIADLVERAGPALVVAGRIVTLAEWLEALPADLLNNQPTLLSIQGIVAVMQGDTKKGLQLFNRAIELIELPQDAVLLARVLVRRAAAYRMVGDHTASLADAKEALGMIEGDFGLQSLYAEAARSMGVSLFQQGQLKESLSWLTRSLEAYQSLGDSQNEAIIQLETGLVNEALGNFGAAEKMYSNALEYWQDTGNSVWQANLLNNLGVLQYQIGDFESAASTLEKALQHAKISGYQRLEAYALAGIGDLYRDLEAYPEAMEAYHQAHLIASDIENLYLLFYLGLAQALLYARQKKFPQAYDYLESARQQAEENGSPFEQYLCDLEGANIKILENKPLDALGLLSQIAPYFEQEGHLIEALRSHLFLGLAYCETKDYVQAEEHLKQILADDSSEPKSNPLVALCWQLKKHLTALQEDVKASRLVSGLVLQAERFEQKLPGLKRRLRQRASVVPFAPPRIYIQALGKMRVKLNNHVVTNADWQTQAARDLFFLLLAHPEGLTKEAIGTIFWPDGSSSEVKFRFKNTVYRLRHGTAKETILLQDDYYRFNYGLDYEYDAETFQKEIDLAQTVSNRAEKILHLQAALKLYKGPYLPEIEEIWVLPERERLAQIYLDALLQISELYLEDTPPQLTLALDYCQRALIEDPCLEAAHRLAMRIHATMGNRAAVARQYARCQEVLQEEFNADPSPQTQALYQSLMR